MSHLKAHWLQSRQRPKKGGVWFVLYFHLLSTSQNSSHFLSSNLRSVFLWVRESIVPFVSVVLITFPNNGVFPGTWFDKGIEH